MVIGLGGRGVLDLAKAVAGLVTNGGSIEEYGAEEGSPRSFVWGGVPCITVPATGETGEAVTSCLTVSSRHERFHRVIHSPYLSPAVALVDPSLTDDLSPAMTAAAGLEALAMLMESYVSTEPQPYADLLALDGVHRLVEALPRAVRYGGDREARDQLALGSLSSGLCKNNVPLGIIRALAIGLESLYGVTPALASASLLPSATAVLVDLLRRREPDNPVLDRYARLGEVILEREVAERDEAIDGSIARLRKLDEELRIPLLRELGVTPEEYPTLAAHASHLGGRGTPIDLSVGDVDEILRQAY